MFYHKSQLFIDYYHHISVFDGVCITKSFVFHVVLRELLFCVGFRFFFATSLSSCFQFVILNVQMILFVSHFCTRLKRIGIIKNATPGWGKYSILAIYPNLKKIKMRKRNVCLNQLFQCRDTSNLFQKWIYCVIFMKYKVDRLIPSVYSLTYM